MRHDIEEIFAAAGCVGALCVQDAEGQQEIGVAADRPVVAASVIKVLVAVEVERQIAASRLDPCQRIRLPAQGRTPGPVGFSLYADDVEVSLRDLLVPMLTISDNVATDALLALVSIEACNATAAELGLAETVIVDRYHTMIDAIAQAAGFASWDALSTWAAQPHSSASSALVEERVRSSAPMQAQTATRTTPHDMCRLLRLIWSNQAAPAEACRHIRHLMAQQLTRHRLATAFAPPARVAAKSGGLLGVYRHEVGVIEYPDGRWYTAAVFTRITDASRGGGVIDAAIGEAAARAVTLLAPKEAAEPDL
ncbi:MAG TPA: serine hydrolase [Ktedonobacterales bacterium]